jgi:hypothetical protein
MLFRVDTVHFVRRHFYNFDFTHICPKWYLTVLLSVCVILGWFVVLSCCIMYRRQVTRNFALLTTAAAATTATATTTTTTTPTTPETDPSNEGLYNPQSSRLWAHYG